MKYKKILILEIILFFMLGMFYFIYPKNTIVYAADNLTGAAADPEVYVMIGKLENDPDAKDCEIFKIGDLSDSKRVALSANVTNNYNFNFIWSGDKDFIVISAALGGKLYAFEKGKSGSGDWQKLNDTSRTFNMRVKCHVGWGIWNYGHGKSYVHGASGWHCDARVKAHSSWGASDIGPWKVKNIASNPKCKPLSDAEERSIITRGDLVDVSKFQLYRCDFSDKYKDYALKGEKYMYFVKKDKDGYRAWVVLNIKQGEWFTSPEPSKDKKTDNSCNFHGVKSFNKKLSVMYRPYPMYAYQLGSGSPSLDKELSNLIKGVEYKYKFDRLNECGDGCFSTSHEEEGPKETPDVGLAVDVNNWVYALGSKSGTDLKQRIYRIRKGEQTPLTNASTVVVINADGKMQVTGALSACGSLKSLGVAYNRKDTASSFIYVSKAQDIGVSQSWKGTGGIIYVLSTSSGQTIYKVVRDEINHKNLSSIVKLSIPDPAECGIEWKGITADGGGNLYILAVRYGKLQNEGGNKFKQPVWFEVWKFTMFELTKDKIINPLTTNEKFVLARRLVKWNHYKFSSVTEANTYNLSNTNDLSKPPSAINIAYHVSGTQQGTKLAQAKNIDIPRPDITATNPPRLPQDVKAEPDIELDLSESQGASVLNSTNDEYMATESDGTNNQVVFKFPYPAKADPNVMGLNGVSAQTIGIEDTDGDGKKGTLPTSAYAVDKDSPIYPTAVYAWQIYFDEADKKDLIFKMKFDRSSQKWKLIDKKGKELATLGLGEKVTVDSIMVELPAKPAEALDGRKVTFRFKKAGKYKVRSIVEFVQYKLDTINKAIGEGKLASVLDEIDKELKPGTTLVNSIDGDETTKAEKKYLKTTTIIADSIVKVETKKELLPFIESFEISSNKTIDEDTTCGKDIWAKLRIRFVKAMDIQGGPNDGGKTTVYDGIGCWAYKDWYDGYGAKLVNDNRKPHNYKSKNNPDKNKRNDGTKTKTGVLDASGKIAGTHAYTSSDSNIEDLDKKIFHYAWIIEPDLDDGMSGKQFNFNRDLANKKNKYKEKNTWKKMILLGDLTSKNVDISKKGVGLFEITIHLSKDDLFKFLVPGKYKLSLWLEYPTVKWQKGKNSEMKGKAVAFYDLVPGDVQKANLFNSYLNPTTGKVIGGKYITVTVNPSTPPILEYMNVDNSFSTGDIYPGRIEFKLLANTSFNFAAPKLNELRIKWDEDKDENAKPDSKPADKDKTSLVLKNILILSSSNVTVENTFGNKWEEAIKQALIDGAEPENKLSPYRFYVGREAVYYYQYGKSGSKQIEVPIDKSFVWIWPIIKFEKAGKDFLLGDTRSDDLSGGTITLKSKKNDNLLANEWQTNEINIAIADGSTLHYVPVLSCLKVYDNDAPLFDLKIFNFRTYKETKFLQDDLMNDVYKEEWQQTATGLKITKQGKIKITFDGELDENYKPISTSLDKVYKPNEGKKVYEISNVDDYVHGPMKEWIYPSREVDIFKAGQYLLVKQVKTRITVGGFKDNINSEEELKQTAKLTIGPGVKTGSGEIQIIGNWYWDNTKHEGFIYILPVTEGENTIEVTVKDKAGNEKHLVLPVKVVPATAIENRFSIEQSGQ